MKKPAGIHPDDYYDYDGRPPQPHYPGRPIKWSTYLARLDAEDRRLSIADLDGINACSTKAWAEGKETP